MPSLWTSVTWTDWVKQLHCLRATQIRCLFPIQTSPLEAAPLVVHLAKVKSSPTAAMIPACKHGTLSAVISSS